MFCRCSLSGCRPLPEPAEKWQEPGLVQSGFVLKNLRPLSGNPNVGARDGSDASLGFRTKQPLKRPLHSKLELETGSAETVQRVKLLFNQTPKGTAAKGPKGSLTSVLA